MEERIKERKKRDRGLDKWGVKSVPRKRKTTSMQKLYNFKNTVDGNERTNLTGVKIELLHTDELMAYYKELVSKGNRDLTEHQRLQNEIKRLEYESMACGSKSRKRRRNNASKSRQHSPSKMTPVKPAEQVQTMIVSDQLTQKSMKKKVKSRTPAKMRKTVAY